MTTEILEKQLNVNSIRLTPKYRIGKMERKILILVGNGYKSKDVTFGGINFGAASYFPNEGCNMRFLVEHLFVDSIDYTEMKVIPKVIVSRALHSLYRKGLVKMGLYPSKGRKEWGKSDDCSSGYYGGMLPINRRVSLYFKEHGEAKDGERIELESSDTYTDLPHGTHKWWMLTDAGKDLVASWQSSSDAVKTGLEANLPQEQKELIEAIA